MHYNKTKFSTKALATFLGLLFAVQPIAEKFNIKQKDEFKDWKNAHSIEGKCSAAFPKTPEHIVQKMPMKGQDKELQYYIYVSDLDKKEVFMVLVAQYPGEITEENALPNLEHFLNTLISQNANNRLIFADLVKVHGFPGMDFFIRTDQVYFKGRAIQANNSLYLLAMECEVCNYQEEHFKYFIESFKFYLDK